MMPRTQAMQKRRSATKALDSFVNFLLACLPLIGFLLFMLIPMVLGFGMSFMQLYTPVFSDGVFCGFDNYARLLWGEDAAMFYRAFLNTIIFWLNVPVSMALGLGSGAEMTQPMAVVTIGGLTYATALTLIVVPVIYDLMHRRPMRSQSLEED